jgi:hypothetical protein
MGYMNDQYIKNAANHLLDILKNESLVNFSRFYDGTEETDNKMAKIIGTEDASVAMDCAIIQLIDQRIVKTKKAIDILGEDACGYEGHNIILTDFGKGQLAAGAKLQFVGMDL